MESTIAALWQMEERFWTGGEEVYRTHLAQDSLMVFPGMVLDRDQTVASIATAPRWVTVRFEQQRAVQLGESVVALNYRAEAKRAGDAPPYATLATSVYVLREAEWKLVLHQQTP